MLNTSNEMFSEDISETNQSEDKLRYFDNTERLNYEKFYTQQNLTGLGKINSFKKCLVLISISLVILLVATKINLINYFDYFGFTIIVSGLVIVSITQFSHKELKQAFKDFIWSFSSTQKNLSQTMMFFVDLSRKQKIEGILTLENEAENCRDPFIKTALELVLDNKNNVKEILENEIVLFQYNKEKSVQIVHTLGVYAPAMGLIGTVIGLIEMLKSISNPSTLGGSMSIALISTLYGALLSNLILLPIAGKIKNKIEEEIMFRRIGIIGAESLSKDESQYILSQKFNSIISGI